MKYLLALATLALSLSLNAQLTITAATVSIRYTVDGVNLPISTATPGMVQGLWLSYQQNVAANGTNAPTFGQFVKQECNDRLKGLADEAAADEMVTNKIDQAGISRELWSKLSASEKATVTSIFKPLLP